MAFTTIDNAELYFQTKIYSGTGSSLALTLDGTENMSPNLIWLKRRSAGGNHFLYDSVRGANKALVPNETDVEDSSGEAASYLSSFDSDGFTLGGSYSNTNASGSTYVAWCWKEASGIMDINLHTGNGSARTISHNLGAVPSWIICKGRDWAEEWETYHVRRGNDHSLKINNDNTGDSGSGRWNSTTPTSSVYSVGTADATNKDTKLFVTYLFSEVQGYSKFGKFTANGNDDNCFCWCGFEPAFIMHKNIDTHDTWNRWYIFDTKRDPINLADQEQTANEALADDTGGSDYAQIDILANGFKIRKGSSWGIGGSGQNSIFMAFARAPFVNSSGVPANAR